MEKTIKYLENGEYHYATVRSVGDLAQLKTNSKETLVEAINELWNGGGNADPSKAPKPEGYDKLIEDVADAVKNQQEISQQWIEWQNEEAQLTEERKQAYLQAMKEMQEAIDKAKADAAALDDKTAKLDEQITKTFSDLDTSIQNMHEQLQKEADRMNKDLQDTKGSLTTLRTDLQNTQMDNGKIHDELTNINGKFEHKVWQTDLDPLKEQIDRAETSVQQTKDELLGKASRQDLDTVSNTVSKLDTQLKETAKGVEISVKKDELGGEIAEALTNKTNILLGTRRFTTNNWTQRDHVEICSDPWKGFLVAKQNSPIEGIQQAYDVKAGTTYTFSLFAKMDNLDDSNKPQITLAQNNLDTSLDTKIDVWRKDIDDITSDFKRYDLTFTPSEDCTIYPHVISNSNNPIFVCGYQLEIGKTSTPWEPNQEDVGDYVEKSEAQFNVYNDKIQALTEKQRQQGDTQEKLRTEVTQTAEGTKQVSENLKKTNDDITKLRGEFEVKADHMKSEYETYTNKAVGQISDSTLNLIRNSSFQNKDSDFDQWQNISAKANVRSDENGLRWVELTQSGLTTNNPEGITSNYFNIKQGKVTIAVDIKSGDKSSLDNDSVLSLELYNDAKKRVDFYDVSLSQLGLSKELLGDYKVHRGLYRLGIDRNDAKYMTVKAKLVKNGDLYFTNFSARLSSIDDGAYEPNPDDINQQILKQNTKIEQNAKEVAIKANSVDVTRDIKSAVDGIQVGGTNLISNSGTDIVIESKTTDGFPQWKNKSVYQNLIPGKTYTFSVSATNTNGVEQASVRIYKDSLNGKYINKEATHWFFNADGERHSFTFTTPNDAIPYDILLYAGPMGTLQGKNFTTTYHHPQLELGNKSTSWSPAPEDTSAEIKSAKEAAIKVASDQINIHVNELTTSFDDKLNKRVNEVKTASEKFTSDGIEQTVTKITNVKNDVDRLGDKVNGIQVGGRNLLISTSENEISGKAYSFANYQISGGLQPNKTYTLSGWARVDQDALNHKQWVMVYVYADDWSWSVNLNIDASATSKYNKLTFTTPVGKQLHPYVTVYLSHPDGGTNENNNDAISGKAYIKKLKLEEGNFATDYTHAPEDIDKKIDTQTLDSANIDNLKTQGHYFVRNLTGNPIGGWVYVDVTGNNNDRIRQDVYQDNGSKHMYRRGLNGTWSGWEQGAYLSDVKTEVTASVKNLGDRVTTEVNSVETRVNNKIDGIQVGGRNILSNTENLVYKAKVTNSTNNPNSGDSMWKLAVGNLSDWLRNNPDVKEIAISYDYELQGATPTGTIRFGVNQAPAWEYMSGFNLQGKPAKGRVKLIVPVTDNMRETASNISRIRGDGLPIGATLIISHPKWEVGNKATDWSPAPEDTVEAIKEVNTKWDVANGQIQGKVTATDVNNILNGKGYATQSWAQTMFQMKSDSITLQAVRDNITNGIQNQVNSIDQRVKNTKVGSKNLFEGTNRGTFGWWTGQQTGNTNSGQMPINGENGVRFTHGQKPGGWWVVQYPFNIHKLKPNTKYTISFDIRTSQDKNENVYVGIAEGDSSASPFVESPYIRIQTKANQVTHVTQTLTTKDNIPMQSQAFYFNSWSIGQCDWVDFVNLMMVEGTQSSEWSPAPEDIGNGVNVLRGTADFSWPTGIGTNNVVNLGYEKFDATTIQLHIWGKDSGIYTKWGGAFPDGEIQVGEAYTFSFDIKGSGTFSNVKNESESGSPANGIKVSGNWQRVSVSGTINSLGKAFIIYFQGNYDVRIKNVKIERGSKATPWTPHPFDDKDKGVNLLKSTAYWNPADWNHISNNVWYDDGWVDSSGHKAYGHHTAWQGLGQTVYVTQGVYTWSAKIYLNGLDSNDFVYPYMGDGQYNGTAQVQDIRKPMLGVNDQNRWIDYSTTFYVKNAGNLCVRPELNRDHGNIHVGSQKLEHGMVATPWTPSPYDSDPKNIVSAINITPDQIKIASNKIVIDGNTDIHGVLRVPEVRLQGKSGMIGLDGNKGIIISSADTLFQTRVTKFGMDFLTTTNGRKEIMGGITTGFSTNNGNLNGISIVLDTQQKLGYPYGGDFFSIGNTTSIVNDDNRSWNRAMDYDASGQLHQGGFMWYEKSYLTGEGQRIYVGGVRGNGNSAYDPILIGTHQWSKAVQSDVPQPLITLGYGGTINSNSGLGLVWNQMKPYGNWDITDVNDIWYDGQHFRFTWVSHPEMMSNASCPSFVRLDSNGAVASGICFAWGSVWAMGAARGGNIVKLLL